MIARSLVLLFFGILLIQAKPLDDQQNSQSATLEAKEEALNMVRAIPSHVVVHSITTELPTDPPLSESEKDEVLVEYVEMMAELLSRLTKHVAQFATAMVNSSRDISLAVVKGASEVLADDVKEMRPLVLNVTQDIRYFNLANRYIINKLV